jgi:hypothetical protein
MARGGDTTQRQMMLFPGQEGTGFVPKRGRINIRWLAGFFDGEGSFYAFRRGRRNSKKFTWVPGVNLSNTNRDILLEIQRQFGGNLVCNITSKSKKDHWKSEHQLMWLHRKAAPLIRLILPHLRLKTEQARLVLALAENMEDKTSLGRGIPNSADVIAFRDGIVQQVKALNKRGRREVANGTKGA